MPEETKIAEAAKEETAKEAIVDKVMTPAEKVADAIADRLEKEPTFGPDEKTVDAESTEEVDEEKETSEPESESATDKKTDDSDEAKPEKEVEEPADDEEAVAHIKASMQKRIDKLTAENKSKDERLARIEARLDKVPEDKKEIVYTKDQLRAATKKFMEEGDSEGMFEVMEYMSRQETKALKNEYLQEQVRIKESAKAKEREWNSVTMHYSNDEDPTLDIRKTNSTLYKVAKQLFEDPEVGPTYLLPGGGGMLQAVADAHAEILKYRADKGLKEKKPIVKAKQVKERRKSAMAGTGSMKQEGSLKKGSGSELEDYLAERKTSIAAKKGVPIGD